MAMMIHGREVHFRRTVWATCEISKLCPGRDLARLAEAMGDNFADNMEVTARIAVILSEADAQARRWEGKGDVRPLMMEELMTLDLAEFVSVTTEAMAAFNRDAETTVEAEPVKKTDGADSPVPSA